MTRRAEWGVWSVAIASAALSVFFGPPKPDTPVSVAPAVTAVQGLEPRDSTSVAAAAGLVAARNPFRLDRQPVDVEFPESPADVQPPASARPILVLRGLIGGAAWDAIIEGVPTIRGTALVRSGDVIGELFVRDVSGERVLIEGMDTTWILRMDAGPHDE